LGLSEAFRDDFCEDGPDGGRGFAAISFWEESGEAVEAEDCGALSVRLELDERFVDGLGVCLFELFGEDGAEHDISGDAGHFTVDFEGG
jgi:hypothetical protein